MKGWGAFKDKISSRMSLLLDEGAFVVLAKAKELERQGREIIHLEIGEPDFDTPENIKKAAIKAMYDGYTHYTPTVGLYQVREAIARYVRRLRGVEVTPENVVVTSGAKVAVTTSLTLVVDEGDEVIIPAPAYPTYESVVRVCGGKPVLVPLREELGFRITGADICERVTDKTKAVVLNSPQNPTGFVFTEKDLREIAQVAKEKDLIVITDEIYGRLYYDGDVAPSIISVDEEVAERTVYIDGFSKVYAMTGWRLGFAVVPEKMADQFSLYLNNATSCPNAFVQMAGIEALEGDQGEVEKMIAEFKRRREVIYDGLKDVKGFKVIKTPGAFYLFPNVKEILQHKGWTSTQLADYFLYEADVALLPGTAFGSLGEGYLRISYANSVENLEKAAEKIRAAVEKLL